MKLEEPENINTDPKYAREFGDIFPRVFIEYGCQEKVHIELPTEGCTAGDTLRKVERDFDAGLYQDSYTQPKGKALSLLSVVGYEAASLAFDAGIPPQQLLGNGPTVFDAHRWDQAYARELLSRVLRLASLANRRENFPLMKSPRNQLWCYIAQRVADWDNRELPRQAHIDFSFAVDCLARMVTDWWSDPFGDRDPNDLKSNMPPLLTIDLLQVLDWAYKNSRCQQRGISCDFEAFFSAMDEGGPEWN